MVLVVGWVALERTLKLAVHTGRGHVWGQHFEKVLFLLWCLWWAVWHWSATLKLEGRWIPEIPGKAAVYTGTCLSQGIIWPILGVNKYFL